MLEKLTFTNNEGESFTSAENGIFAQYNELHDYLWEYDTSDANKILQFSRGVVKKTLPLVILCSSEEEGIRIKNSLMEIADKDILAQSPGRFTINDYYMEGYIIGSTKSVYLYSKRYMEVSLTVLTDNPVWIKESTVHFLPESRSEGDTENAAIDPVVTGEEYHGEAVDYPYIRADYAYDYVRESDKKVSYPERDYPWEYYHYNYGRQTIENDFYRACNFELVIWGYVVNPSIIIGDHLYTVETTVNEGERIVINSINKTVVKIDSHGNETNIYNSRGKEYSVFDERSEPIWSL